jgi:hypothetical protein
MTTNFVIVSLVIIPKNQLVYYQVIVKTLWQLCQKKFKEKDMSNIKSAVPFSVTAKNSKGEVLTPNQDDSLIVEAGRVTVAVSITDPDLTTSIFVFLVDKGNNAQKTKKMRRNINILTGEKGLYTIWPDNQISVASITKEGNLQIWEVSLISQGGKIYQKTLMKHNVQCFADVNSRIICPKLSKWKTLLNIINEEITTSMSFQKMYPPN